MKNTHKRGTMPKLKKRKIQPEVMVDFDPRFTEVIFLDIECYVPPEARKKSKGSMIYNPARIDNFVLGGVFRRTFPRQNKIEPPWQVWNWAKENEKTTLQQIYDYINESWRMIEGRTANHPDLILAGIGISRLDVPTLYVRSSLHQIDSEVALYETYFKTKIVDLGDVGIALFRNKPEIYPLYPKTSNALMSRLGIQGRKVSGKSVWDLYESREFDAIMERTASEVEDAIKIASKIVSGKV
jgi:hypothetical protein